MLEDLTDECLEILRILHKAQFEYERLFINPVVQPKLDAIVDLPDSEQLAELEKLLDELLESKFMREPKVLETYRSKVRAAIKLLKS